MPTQEPEPVAAGVSDEDVHFYCQSDRSATQGGRETRPVIFRRGWHAVRFVCPKCLKISDIEPIRPEYERSSAWTFFRPKARAHGASRAFA
jgi:hypothetical protein